MVHEETADLLRSARPKILQILFSAKTRKPKSNFAKISGESYPCRGWPQRQAVVYASDIKREWFGAIEGRDKPSWPPAPTLLRISRASLDAFRPRASQLHTLACSQLLQPMIRPCRHHSYADR